MEYTVSVANGCSGATLGLPGIVLGSLVLRFQESSDDSSHLFLFLYFVNPEPQTLSRSAPVGGGSGRLWLVGRHQVLGELAQRIRAAHLLFQERQFHHAKVLIKVVELRRRGLGFCMFFP